MIINIFLFFTIALIFTTVIFGYGYCFKIIFGKDLNIKNHEIGFFGYVLIFLLSNIIHFFSPLSIFVSYLLIFVGLIFFINNFEFKKYLKKKNFYISIFLFLLLSLTINYHDDRYWYQLPYINYFQNYKIIIGANALNTYFYGNAIYDIMSIFNLGFLPNSILYIIPCTIIFFLIFFLLEEYKLNKFSKGLIYIVFFLVIIFLRYTRSKEYGADLITMSYMFLVVYYTYKLVNRNQNYSIFKIYIFFIFSIFSKLYSIFFIFFPIFLFIKNFRQTLSLFKKKLLLIFFIFLISIPFLKNYLHSSCLMYPVKITCFSSNSWYNGDKIINHLEIGGSALAKGFKNYIYEKNNPKLTYEDFFSEHKYSYFKYLIKDKDFERFILIIFILFVSFFVCFKKKNLNKYFSKFNLIFLILSVFSFLFWLFTLPQTRYGGNIVILIFIASILNYLFDDWRFNLNKISKIYLIFLFGFIVFKNLDRIKNEIIFAKDNNLNFPFRNLNDFSGYGSTKFGLDFIITNHKRYCVDVKKLCITKEYYEAIDDIYNKKSYNIVKPNKSKLVQAHEINVLDHKETYINYK